MHEIKEVVEKCMNWSKPDTFYMGNVCISTESPFTKDLFDMSLGKEAERVARTAHNQGGKLALAKLVDRNVK